MTEALKDTPEEKNTLTLNEFGALLVESKETNLKKANDKFLEAFKAKAMSCNRSSQDKKKIAGFIRKLKENFLENYFLKFDAKISKQIKELEYDRLILIVGKDVELAESVATCIYCMYKEVYNPTEHTLSVKKGEYTSRGISFCEHSYIGWDEGDIKKHLFSLKNPLTNHFKNGDILFLRGINSQSILDGLVDVSRKLYNYGVLIINVTRTNDLPEILVNKFKVIRLEPGSKDTPKPQGDPVFVYDKQKPCLSHNDINMRLSERRNKLLRFLRKPKNIREVLRKFYNETISSDDKVIKNKRASFDSYISKFNTAWRDCFRLNEEMELIKCDNKIVSIAQKIEW